MSRLGRLPVILPPGVKAYLDSSTLRLEGPLGQLCQKVPDDLGVQMEDGSLIINQVRETRQASAQQGLMRALVVSMVKGVTSGFEKVLEITGVGYRAEVKGNDLVLSLGFSHPIIFPLPPGIKAEVAERGTRVAVKGIDKQLVGQVAADLRRFRKPDPYKGKGIKYLGEKLRRKVGKTGVK